jgi:hypothetical protein
MSIQKLKDAAAETQETYVPIRAEDLAKAFEELGENCPDPRLRDHANAIAFGGKIKGVPKSGGNPDAIINLHRGTHVKLILEAAEKKT